MFKIVIIALLWATSSFGSHCTVAASTIERQGQKNADALVFIPGLASHGDLWTRWAEQHAVNYNVYIVTASGFAGEPAKLAQTPFLQSTVADIAQRLRADNIEGATIVGHSIGGLMALMLAKEAPELVTKVLVVDSLPYLAGMFMPGIKPDQAREQANMIAGQLKSMSRDLFLAQQKQGLSRLSNTAEFLPTLIKWSEDSHQTTVAVAMGEALATDYRSALATVEASITVLAAYSKAMQVPKAQIKALYAAQYAAAQNVDIQLVDDSYHFIMIDQPDQFSHYLSAVLGQGETK